MTATLLDISDISIRVWKDGVLVCDSPSVAHVTGAQVIFGEEALAISRSEPQGLYSRHWSAIDTTPLMRATKVARHHGDLIYRHLSQLQKQHGLGDDIIISVPPEFNTEQLSLLMGIVQSLNLSVIGLVDSAVANVAGDACSDSMVQYIELGLYRATITKLSLGQHTEFESVQTIESVGVDYFTNTCLNWVADCFLDQTRFDPLQQAQTEQLIFDHLTSWLGTLNHAPNINVEIEHLERSHSVSLSRNALLELLRPSVSLLTEAVDHDYPVVLSHRLSTYPTELFDGLAARTSLSATSSTNVFTTIEKHLDDILCSPEEIVFTRQLNGRSSSEQADGA